ncbi:MAG TPA: type VI secretion system baseplate subunit TssF [Pirellulales bacterium]|nr:type VI secretion system baseplate subunit TssF [Pirellulales bacterium]
MTRNPLETFYESELSYIRQMGADFARERPKIADRLLLDRETGKSTDPHVERIIEAFAFLTARVQLKLHDEFPQLTEALLGTLYPHYLAPIPSMAVVEFEVDPARANLPQGHTIERHSRLFSREVRGTPCRFRTAYPVTLWPIEVKQVRYQTSPFGKDVVPPPKAQQAKSMLRLELAAAPGASLADLQLEQLRFFLSGRDSVVHPLYELLFNHVVQGLMRGGPSGDEPLVLLSPDSLKPVGFGRDEGLLSYPNRSFLGYRLLTEYFVFPNKFLFVDLQWPPLDRFRLTDRLDILLFFDRAIPNLESQVSAETFRLGCTPIINLFEQEADPIRITQTKTEYQVLPDVRNHSVMEVYSVDAVESTNLETQQTVDYQPVYAFKHASDVDRQRAYWQMIRRPSVRQNDQGTDVFLSLVDMAFEPRLPPAEVLMVRTTCTNRDLPKDLRAAGGEDWGFQLEAVAPCRRVIPIVPPTSPARLPPEEYHWRLLSHLALNHLSISDAEDGAAALREVLKVYDYASTAVSRQHIDGIESVSSRRKVAPISDGLGRGFCRGIEITIEFDEEKYAGSGAFLFASVLERFLALYASINSVTRLVARLKQREGYLKQWPFRVGDQTSL